MKISRHENLGPPSYLNNNTLLNFEKPFQSWIFCIPKNWSSTFSSHKAQGSKTNQEPNTRNPAKSKQQLLPLISAPFFQTLKGIPERIKQEKEEKWACKREGPPSSVAPRVTWIEPPAAGTRTRHAACHMVPLLTTPLPSRPQLGLLTEKSPGER